MGTRISQGIVEEVEKDLQRAIFFVDTVVDALPPAPAPAAPAAPAPVSEAETLLTTGPTLETYVAAGYPADKYPPEGYAERDSPGLRKYRARQAWDEWVKGGKVGPAPGPAPEEDASHVAQPATDGSQANGALETAVTTSGSTAGESQR